MSQASQVWNLLLVLFLQVCVAGFLEAGRRRGQAGAPHAPGGLGKAASARLRIPPQPCSSTSLNNTLNSGVPDKL